MEKLKNLQLELYIAEQLNDKRKIKSTKAKIKRLESKGDK